jgi:plastocyanin
MRQLTILLAALLAAGALTAVGCGGDDNGDGGGSGGGGGGSQKASSGGGGGGGGATTLKLKADAGGALKFDKKKLKAKAGTVTISLDNPSSVPHAVEVEGKGVEKSSSTIGKGETTKVTAKLKPGEYEFYCPVDSHKQQGMEGTLTVQ